VGCFYFLQKITFTIFTNKSVNIQANTMTKTTSQSGKMVVCQPGIKAVKKSKYVKSAARDAPTIKNKKTSFFINYYCLLAPIGANILAVFL